MTPEIEKVLAEATPRPWCPAECDPLEISSEVRIMVASIIRMEGQTYGNGQREANAKLIVLAVNSYEADQERMRVLTETVEAIHQLARSAPNGYESVYSNHQRNDINDLAIAAITALSQAKAVKP